MTKMTIYLFKKGMYKFKKMISFCDFVISERLCLFWFPVFVWCVFDFPS